MGTQHSRATIIISIEGKIPLDFQTTFWGGWVTALGAGLHPGSMSQTTQEILNILWASGVPTRQGWEGRIGPECGPRCRGYPPHSESLPGTPGPSIFLKTGLYLLPYSSHLEDPSWG